MTGTLVALACLAIAVLIQRLALERRARRLKATEQAFRFHAIRDQLQELALEGAVHQHDQVYRFVMFTANLAICNAGVMKLRDILAIAQTVDSEISEQTHTFFRDVKRQPEQMQRLVGATFETLAQMLVANDFLMRAGLRTAVLASRAWTIARPVLLAVTRAVDWLARYLAPTRAKAVWYARRYNDLGDRLRPA